MKLLLFCLLLLATPTMADMPNGVDIVVLGEVHDNPDAHLGQAAALAKLGPKAVIFEMLSADDGERANADRDAIAAIWAKTGWPDFALYAPIFQAAGDAVIIGAAVPRATVRPVFEQGAAAVFGPEAGRFGLDQPLPEAQQDTRAALQFEAHCRKMPSDLMPGLVEVQRYRDARFAQSALDALAAYGPPVVVIAGNGHARTDWGVPAAIKTAAPDVVVYSLAFTEAGGDSPFDEVHIVPEASRPDPCAAFD